MNGRCPTCTEEFQVSGRRGSTVADRRCPNCQAVLIGITTGKARGRYLCPLANGVVTLGLTAVELATPHELLYQPGGEYGRQRSRQDQPGSLDQAILDRVAGRILGPGCVISDFYDPARAGRRGSAGLVLRATEAADGRPMLLSPAAHYRACAACGDKTLDLPTNRPATAWRPKRREHPVGRGRLRHIEAVDRGPHHPGTLVCASCDPRPSSCRNPW